MRAGAIRWLGFGAIALGTTSVALKIWHDMHHKPHVPAASALVLDMLFWTGIGLGVMGLVCSGAALGAGSDGRGVAVVGLAVNMAALALWVLLMT